MSRRANPALVGAFVIGGLAILVAGLLVLGSGRLSGDRETLILFFRTSASGLRVGAPVVLKGVQIGIVKEISVVYDDESGRFLVPVLVEIDQDLVEWPGEIRGELNSRALYEQALEAGLRARLDLQSLVTGLLEIEIGFFPGADLILHGRNQGYRELPTIRSPLERLQDQMENVPLEEIVERVIAVLGGLDRLVNANETSEILTNLSEGTADLAAIAADLRERVGPAGERLDDSLDDLHKVAGALAARAEGLLDSVELALSEIRMLMSSARSEVGPLTRGLRRAGASAESAFRSAESASDAVASTMGASAPLHREAIETLRSLARAARSVRDLADYLERHPESLVRGKP
jgi:paraquat-inducible protein B